ncbi:hypothetical protein K7W03_23595, partial [Sphingobium sp. PNB]|uniref:hypothetical protein n=1 Tax=Sphingobium sp. PNB TaxID=863934 RepID=UPI001CA43636
MMRGHPAGVCARAKHDLVVVFRCGKPAFVVVHFAYATEFLDIRCQPARKVDPLSAPNIDPLFVSVGGYPGS